MRRVALERACEHLLSLQDGRLVAGRAADERDDGRRGHAAARVPRYPPAARDRALGRLDPLPAAPRRHLGQLPRRSRGPVHHDRGLLGAAPGRRLPRAAHMRAAAAFIRAQGGLEQARVFTHVWLALFGLWSWDHVPALPPEIILLPSWVPLNIYDFACWARQTIVALSLVKAHRPVRALRFDLDELRAAPWRPRDPPGARAPARAWLARPGPRVRRLRAAAVRAPAPARAGARRALDRAPPGGGRLLGRHPAAVGVLADGAAPLRLPARSPGHEARPRRARAVHDRGPRRPARVGAPAGPSRRLEACQSPVWDTALAIVALGDAGLSGEHPAIVRAAEWLLAEEVTGRGDWAVARPAADARRLGLRVRERQLPRRRRHRRGGARAARVARAADARHAANAAQDGAPSPATDGAHHGAVERAVQWVEGMQSRRRRLGRLRRRQHARAGARAAVPGLRRGDRRAERRRHRPRARDARRARPRRRPARRRGVAGCSTARSPTARGSAAGASTTCMGRGRPCRR